MIFGNPRENKSSINELLITCILISLFLFITPIANSASVCVIVPNWLVAGLDFQICTFNFLPPRCLPGQRLSRHHRTRGYFNHIDRTNCHPLVRENGFLASHSCSVYGCTAYSSFKFIGIPSTIDRIILVVLVQGSRHTCKSDTSNSVRKWRAPSDRYVECLCGM